MWPTRARGHELEHRVEHAQAGAQHRHHDDVARHPSARRRAEGRLDGRRRRVGMSRSASAASSTLMRVAARRKSSGGVRLSRSDTSASWTRG